MCGASTDDVAASVAGACTSGYCVAGAVVGAAFGSAGVAGVAGAVVGAAFGSVGVAGTAGAVVVGAAAVVEGRVIGVPIWSLTTGADANGSVAL